jgi:ABC-type multidrug transport system permease subunit
MAMLVKSHADQSTLTNFIITPMAFLGGTFFPVDRLPDWAQKLVYLLPLTHASNAIRQTAFGMAPNYFSYLLLTVIGLAFFFIALKCVKQARD